MLSSITVCNNPHCTGHYTSPEGIIRDARRSVKEHGWTIVPILGSTPAFIYTAGLTARRWPELCIQDRRTLSDHELMGLSNFLNALTQQLVDGNTRPTDGLVVTTTYKGATVTCCLTTRLDTRLFSLARRLHPKRSISALTVEFIDAHHAADHDRTGV